MLVNDLVSFDIALTCNAHYIEYVDNPDEETLSKVDKYLHT